MSIKFFLIGNSPQDDPVVKVIILELRTADDPVVKGDHPYLSRIAAVMRWLVPHGTLDVYRGKYPFAPIAKHW